jgi:hypothetical protein
MLQRARSWLSGQGKEGVESPELDADGPSEHTHSKTRKEERPAHHSHAPAPVRPSMGRGRGLCAW